MTGFGHSELLVWRDRLTDILSQIGNIHENTLVENIRDELKKNNSMLGQTRILAIEIIQDIDNLWENALQISPALNRLSQSVNGKRGFDKEENYISELKIRKIKSDGKDIFSSSDSGELLSLEQFMLFLDETLMEIKTRIRTLSMSADKLSERVLRLKQKAARSSVRLSELNDAEKDIAADPVKVARIIDGLELVVIKEISNAESCSSEMKVAEEHVNYLQKLATGTPYADIVKDLGEWLDYIRKGSFAASRHAAALKGLENWASQAVKIENFMSGKN